MPNGDGGGFDFSGVFGNLLTEISLTLDAIIVFLNQLVTVLARSLDALLAGELGIFQYTQAVDRSVWSILRAIFKDIFTLHLSLALHHILDLYNKLKRWAQKLKQWLDKWRRLQQLYHGKAFRDFINAIQRIRRLLVIFRILHLKFATKLDNWLAGIEGNLIRHEVFFAAKLNTVIAWLNIFWDPTGAVRRFPFFLALLRTPDALLTVFTGRGLDFWYSKRLSSSVKLPPSITPSQHYDALRVDLATGGGQVGAWRQSFATSLALYR
jgi:hypothetical protein